MTVITNLGRTHRIVCACGRPAAWYAHPVGRTHRPDRVPICDDCAAVIGRIGWTIDGPIDEGDQP